MSMTVIFLLILSALIFNTMANYLFYEGVRQNSFLLLLLAAILVVLAALVLTAVIGAC